MAIFRKKNFDLDGMYNVQNDRVWAINRQKVDKNGGMKKKNINLQQR